MPASLSNPPRPRAVIFAPSLVDFKLNVVNDVADDIVVVNVSLLEVEKLENDEKHDVGEGGAQAQGRFSYYLLAPSRKL